MIKVVSMFTGGGGLDLMFHKSKNFDVVAHSEINKFASGVLDYHHPNVPNLGDITTIDPGDVPEHDMLIGGFPCTDISTQGKQKGIKAGKKSGLYSYMLPIIDKHKPKYLLFENVKNLLSKQMEQDLLYVKRTIASRGYKFKIIQLDSSNFRTKQQRIRIFIVGVRKDIQVRKSDFEYALGRSYQGKNFPLVGSCNYISWSKSTRKEHTDYRIREDGLINTLTTGAGCKGASTGTIVRDGNTIRNLDPRECEHLMYWPTDHTRYGIIGGKKVEISKSQRYRICGNGVVSSMSLPFITLINKIEWRMK